MQEDVTVIRDLIRDEEEAIVGYEKAIATIKNDKIARLLKDIHDEEIVHIGELKTALLELGVDDSRLEAQGMEEATDKLMEAVRELYHVFE